MTIQKIEHFFEPRSVALIGASAEHGTVGYTVMQNLLQGGFGGDIWLVNPHYDALEGRHCYPDVQSLPDAPDLAVLATPPATIPSLVDELGRRGTRAAVVITAGLRTEGLQEEMMEAAKRHGICGSWVRIASASCRPVSVSTPVSIGLQSEPRIGAQKGPQRASFCSAPAEPILPSRPIYSMSRRAQRRSRTAAVQRPPGGLVLDGREHGGRLVSAGAVSRDVRRGA